MEIFLTFCEALRENNIQGYELDLQVEEYENKLEFLDNYDVEGTPTTMIFTNGIPEEDLPHVFERFYRVDKARTREMGGTGLGLSIAKEILDQNDSMIDIKSDLGKGTEVVIRIPTKQGKNNKDINTEE